MTLQTLLLNGERSGDLRRDEIVRQIMKLTQPDPDEIDFWALGLFHEDPDEDHLTRQMVVFGTLATCADAVAGCLARKPKLPRSSRMRILFAQGEVPEIDCRANDFCF